MKQFKQYLNSDYHRYGNSVPLFQKRLLFWLRKNQTCQSKIIYRWSLLWYSYYSKKHGIEIFPTTQIGEGLYIGHPYNITINNLSIIGKNCNIHKGVTIGQENRGYRKGVPTIGNDVWIGINAVIVGNITIGNDVLIAPNAYVNCDIPDHSVVFGNPCIIKHRDDATQGYINNRVY